jgi:hypothetical protein
MYQLLFATFIFILSVMVYGKPTECGNIYVGAIRWDAWHGDDTKVGAAVKKSLGIERWRERWPLFFTRDSKELDFDETLPGVVEAEDALAYNSGIDFWAFLFYGRSSPMGRVLNTYLNAVDVKTKFAVIVEASRFVKKGRSKIQAREIIEIIDLVNHELYLRDVKGRPIVFVMFSSGSIKETHFKRQVATVLSLSQNKSLKGDSNRIKLVVLSFNPQLAAKLADQLDTEQISSYASHGRHKDGTYNNLVKGVENFWDVQARTGKGVVPIAMTGWDPRPRFDNPVPWGKGYPDKAYYEKGQPQEVSRHVGHAITWAKQHPQGGCMVLIYAWNEFDEGGWLAPTVSEGMSRLRALREVLHKEVLHKQLRQSVKNK